MTNAVAEMRPGEETDSERRTMDVVWVWTEETDIREAGTAGMREEDAPVSGREVDIHSITRRRTSIAGEREERKGTMALSSWGRDGRIN